MIWRLAHSLSIEGHTDAPEKYLEQVSDFQRKAMETVLANLLGRPLTKEQKERIARKGK
jgi:hypothetical protein